MITSVTIESFRGVREGGVEGLAPISILVGPNNTGKSTVLEAMAIVGLGGAASEVARLVLRRGGPPLDALAQVVHRGANQAVVALKRNDKEAPWRTTISIDQTLHQQPLEEARRQGLQDAMRVLRVAAARGPGVARASAYVDSAGKRAHTFADGLAGADLESTVRFVDVEAVRSSGALEDAYTRIDAAGQLTTVTRSLGRAMKGLSDLRILKTGHDFVLHMFFSNGPPVPAYLAGDGFKRFLELAAAVLGAAGGFVLLEEPESFQHPRYLQELAKLVHLTAREGTQVVLSTHSSELIDLLLQAPEGEGQPYPAVHRMSLDEGKLRATTLDREQALNARESLYTDLRA